MQRLYSGGAMDTVRCVKLVVASSLATVVVFFAFLVVMFKMADLRVDARSRFWQS